MQKQLKEAAELLNSCRYVTVLTGAGISTESGIPDFRSPENGLWSKVDPEDFTIQAFNSDPAVLYRHGSGFFSDILKAKPNAAHFALGELESKGLVKSVITQNIDGLHQKGGSENVLEVHGSLSRGICLFCNYLHPMEELMEDVGMGIVPPLCKYCGAPMKPDVTLFGEAMPPAYQDALREAESADAMLVIGSSLLVSPANTLPKRVNKLVIVNREHTIMDNMAQVVINESIAETIPLLSREWISLSEK